MTTQLLLSNTKRLTSMPIGSVCRAASPPICQSIHLGATGYFERCLEKRPGRHPLRPVFVNVCTPDSPALESWRLADSRSPAGHCGLRTVRLAVPCTQKGGLDKFCFALQKCERTTVNNLRTHRALRNRAAQAAASSPITYLFYSLESVHSRL